MSKVNDCRKKVGPRIVVTPSEDVVERAVRLGYTRPAEKDPVFMFNESRTSGLCINMPTFQPICYLGTVTILGHKIPSGRDVALTSNGPTFSGNYIKKALIILGQRRVLLFIHRDDRNMSVFLIGTRKGTVAIAPMIWNDDGPAGVAETTLRLFNYTKGSTTRLTRALTYGLL